MQRSALVQEPRAKGILPVSILRGFTLELWMQFGIELLEQSAFKENVAFPPPLALSVPLVLCICAKYVVKVYIGKWYSSLVVRK